MLSGPEDVEYAYGAELAADRVRLTKIAYVLSVFGSLMYDLLVSRPELVAAMVSFVVGVVSHAMVADTGIMHCGALQVLTTYLHEVHVRLAVLLTLSGR